MTDPREARLAYEAIYGRCSDNHWYRVQRLLKKHSLELTVANVQFFAEIRKLIPRSALGAEGILHSYQKAEEILGKSQRTFKGLEVLEVLRDFGVRPHQTTISRWFKPLGGYRKHKDYSPQSLKSVLVQAFIYKAQFATGLPQEINHG